MQISPQQPQQSSCTSCHLDMATSTSPAFTSTSGGSFCEPPMMDLLVQGHYDAYLTTSFKLLETMRSVMTTPSTSSSCTASLQSVHLPLLEESLLETYHRDESPVVFFNRAIVLHPQAQHEQGSKIPQAAVLLYNVGLCHQAQALQLSTTGSRANFLHKALHFYTLAAKLLSTLQDEQEEDAMQEDDEDLEEDTLGLLRLALMNNLASVHAYFMDVDQTMKCLEHLHEELDYLPLCDESGSFLSVTDDDFCFFSMACALIQAGDSRRQSLVASPAA